MRKWLGFPIALVLGSVLSAALSGRLTVLRVLGQAVMYAGLFGPAYLAPRWYHEWAGRCRLPRFRRRV